MKPMLVPLCFFAQFSRPLTLKQIRRYSWGAEFDGDELKQMLKKTKVQTNGEWFYLDEAHLEAMRSRAHHSPRFWHKVKRWLWLFANIPFLKMVAVSNTLAYDHAGDNSDIDLFVIAGPNRVWTVRAMVLIWLSWFGVRAKGKNKYMKFSPEMLVDEMALDLSVGALADDYLVHYQIVDMVPIWNVQYFDNFWSANRWLKDKLPVAYRSPNKREGFVHHGKSSWFGWMVEGLLSGRFGDKVEAWARAHQCRSIERAKQRLGVDPNVITEPHIIETHFYGRRAEIRDRVDELVASKI